MRINTPFAGLLAVLLALPGTAQAQNPAPGGGGMVPASHLTFGATAHSLARGRGYFEMAQGLFPRFQVGITDHVSFGAGTLAVFPRLVFLTPKVQVYRSDSTSAAIGVVHIAGLGFNGGIAYSVITRDSRARDGGRRWSFTGGAIVAYGGGHTTGQPVGMFGAEHRITSRTTDTVEAYVFSGGALAVVGRRRNWNHWWVNAGLMIPVPVPPVAAIPAPIISFGRQF